MNFRQPVLESFLSAGFLVGPAVGGILSTNYGVDMAFLATAGYCFLACLVGCCTLTDNKKHSGESS